MDTNRSIEQRHLARPDHPERIATILNVSLYRAAIPYSTIFYWTLLPRTGRIALRGQHNSTRLDSMKQANTRPITLKGHTTERHNRCLVNTFRITLWGSETGLG